MAHILVIDDDEMICESLSLRVRALGHAAATASTLKDGLAAARAEAFDVIFLDVRLPAGNGLDALPAFRECASSPEVIIITGVGEPDGAEIAVKGGAWDYLQKPFSKQEVALQLKRALEYHEKCAQKLPVLLKRDGIIGSSARLQSHLALLAQAAGTDANVLISGESGTGKELFARAIHDNSARAGKPFVVVDCTTLPENLVESVLFGHAKGAFTGADKIEHGLIHYADGGTVFLDEVGELPPAIQKKFLRVLQEHRFRLVGGQQEISSDFRVVAATNRNVEAMVDAGRFRQDLLYRLRAFTLELSPLRERGADIRELTRHHVARICADQKIAAKGIAEECMQALEAYDWPGNIRELVNTLERVIATAPGAPVLYPQHLPDRIRIHLARTKVTSTPASHAPAGPASVPSDQKSLPSLKTIRESAIAQAESQYLNDLMQRVAWDIPEACRIAGLRRARLYDLLKKYNISR